MKTLVSVLTVAALAIPAATARAVPQGDSAVGSGKNQFFGPLGEAHLSVSAHSDANGDNPSGHVRATGDPVGDTAPFRLEGPVTCLRVVGNRAAIKYRFKQAQGSAEPFQDGGVQIFIEDNDSSGGEDKTTFDPPQPPNAFEHNASKCDDPTARTTYDEIESGDFAVNDAS